jgi:hypothetical protein
MHGRRLPILLAIACSLFMRAWVPAGWMPAASGGTFAIEPCPAADQTPMVRTAGHHGSKHGPSHNVGHGGDCAFAPLQLGFASVDLPPLLPAPAQSAGLPVRVNLGPPFATGPPSLPPPATGPPAIA